MTAIDWRDTIPAEGASWVEWPFAPTGTAAPMATSGVLFFDWLATFTKRAEAREALASLCTIEIAPTDDPLAARQSLARAVLRSCYYASQFRAADGTRAAKARALAHRKAESLADVRKATMRLRALLDLDPALAEHRAVVRVDAMGRALFGNSLGESLAAFEHTLAQNPIARTIDTRELATHFGCLRGGDREGRAASFPRRETALLFALVLTFRTYSTKANPRFVPGGITMPKTGRPHYDIACSFVRATLRVKIDAHDAQKRVASLVQRGAQLIDWQNATGA